MLAPVGEFFLVDFQVQLGNARLQPFLHVSNRPVVMTGAISSRKNPSSAPAAILPIGSSMFWSKYRWIDATAVSRSSRSFDRHPARLGLHS